MANTMSAGQSRLRKLADRFGDVIGTAASRLPDGTAVAWAVHVGDEDLDDDATDDASSNASDDDVTARDSREAAVVTVLGASATDSRVVLLRVVASPLVAMQIVRSLCHRGGEHGALALGALAWLAPEDVSLAPVLARPPAYLLVAPREVGVEDPSAELVVAAGVMWPEALRPLGELRALVVARGGVAPAAPVRMSGGELQAMATSMVGVLRRSIDESAVSAAGHGLAHMIAHGAAPALLRPLVEVLRDATVPPRAREAAAHLLDEAGAIEPVLELFLAPATRPIVESVVRLRVLEGVAAVAVGQPLVEATAVGLPAGFRLESDARIVEIEDALERHPHAWVSWLLEQLPPFEDASPSPTSRVVQALLAPIRDALRRQLQRD
ncbi:MAG: hypothetical protein H0X17_00255 [Deltaproteobacteria bacterium]|nr:hypothetical protein [Deltaproteobacteria bacterium]